MSTKFVLIDRGSEYRNTAVTRRVAEDMIKRGLAVSFESITLSQIKAQRVPVYREDHYFRHVEEDAFVALYDKKRFKATVACWSGTEGLVKIHGTDLMPQTIYACNISGKKTWYPETACVSYAKGQDIDVEIVVFSGFKLLVNGLTPGHFDEARWNSLDKNNLAFKCDEAGNAINGLFK